MEICNGSVDSVSCVNFEGEPYCYDAGYIIIKGSHFDTSNVGKVITPSSFGDGQPFYQLAFENSTSNYIYAQFIYDKSTVFQGPQGLEIASDSRWRPNDHITIFLGPLYGLDMPVWSSYSVDTGSYIGSQSNNKIKVGDTLLVYGDYGLLHAACSYYFTFYPTEKGFTGTMPYCRSTGHNGRYELYCNLGDFEPTNYTFRYFIFEDCPIKNHYIAFKNYVEPVKFYK